MAGMFKKPKRNFRRKVADSDSDQEKEDVSIDNTVDEASVKPAPPPSVPEKKTKEKKKRDKGDKSTKLLSFEDDEGETEVFKVKKSSHSKRIAKQLKKESQREKEEVTETNVGQVVEGDYAADQLKELREKQKPGNLGNGDAPALPSDDDDEDDDGEGDGSHTFRALLQRGEIPDANTIHMIRKRRQMAREMGDFVSIEENNENSGSRLIRDDENDRSDDDEEGRIDFSINTFAKERQKMKDEFLAAEHGSDGEESDQEREWEEQQIRKGVSTQQVLVPSDGYSTGVGVQLDYYSTEYTASLAPATPYAPAQSSFPTPVPVTGGDSSKLTIDIIRKRLQERVDSMEAVHKNHVAEKDRLVQDLEDTETSISQAEGSTDGLEERYRFFQEMRGYVRDLVECLNEKVPRINQLEDQMMELLRQRAQALVKRRQQDVQDQCQDYMANKGSAVLKETDADIARQRRTAEREARKSRRRRAREGKNIRGHHDGLSSDDEESKSEMSKFKMAKERILEQQGIVFDDVIEDFHRLDAIRERFDEWRRKQGESYREAYISLCLPKLFNPLLRLQLVNWNPLEESCADFEESAWFNDLLFYGYDEEVILHRVDDDDDVKLLPSIVDKVLVPKLTALVESVWDPMSTSQTSRLVNLMTKLTNDYPHINSHGKNTQTLLKSIVTRIRKTLDDDVFMPLYPKNVIESKSSGPAVFFQRQFWGCIKLLGNILSWQGILATPILQHMALDSLLNRYIILGLQNSGVNSNALIKCQAIVSTFPKDWFYELGGDKTIPQLENICRYLNYAAETLYQSSLAKKESEQKEAREQIKQISKLLVNIRAMDHAKKMSDKYSFKLS
ncbi:PAX3- and PAX7-binding protein 1-like [Liolophura sinensis]|uniref:PAX3- and PAX7-binding protein 1-like n=1 Tax=Liolophura sinensis TaxID=3198878 RepID=UPI003158635C